VITLSGITWNHTRGLIPMVATAQRYTDEHPEIAIEWKARSLKDFGEFPIEDLVGQFDLLIVDHPFAGYAAANEALLPLDDLLPADLLADLAANSVGRSYESYLAGGHLWALPVDAATPVAGWRSDLLERAGAAVPETWEDVLELARRGLVALPAAAVDALMHWYMLCLALGEEPLSHDDEIVSAETGHQALERLGEFVTLAGPENIDRNPIRTWEAIARGDSIAYCPFAYGYSNYGRSDFTDRPLRFGPLVTLNGVRLRSTLGGTGLAISAHCQSPEAAAEYVGWVASRACQTGLYTVTGGQPGYRGAWQNAGLDAMCNGFFSGTLATHDEAWLRPRYPGYIPFQEDAGALVRDYLRDGGIPADILDRMNARYRESRADV